MWLSGLWCIVLIKGENGKNNLIALSIIPAKMHSIMFTLHSKTTFQNSNFSLTSFTAVLMKLKQRLAKETIFLSYADKLAFYWLIFEESFHLFYVWNKIGCFIMISVTYKNSETSVRFEGTKTLVYVHLLLSAVHFCNYGVVVTNLPKLPSSSKK